MDNHTMRRGIRAAALQQPKSSSLTMVPRRRNSTMPWGRTASGAACLIENRDKQLADMKAWLDRNGETLH